MAGVEVRGERGVFVAQVIRNRPICREHWHLVLKIEDFPEAAPGQFVQILCAEPGEFGWTSGAFIRRPFSIGGLRRRDDHCEIDILHRAIGTGTRWLSRLAAGDSVSVLGPLGQPFEISRQRKAALLVGGGIGLPPLIWLAEKLHQAGHKVMAFCGSRSADLLPLTRVAGVSIAGAQPALSFEEFARHEVPVVLSTDDGSLGAAGRIPEVFAAYLDQHKEVITSSTVYACGPDPMMRAVARAGIERNIPTQVCLERVMACGMGTCQSCVVRVHDDQAADGWRYRLCCTDGPAFDAKAVIWD